MTSVSCAHAEARWIRLPLGRAVGGSGVTTLDVIVVILEASGGQSGLGFSYVLGSEGGVALSAARELLVRHVLGRMLGAPQVLWREMSASLNRVGKGAHYLAMAAVDVAAWDLHAKLIGQPLGVAMGGAPRAVPVYGSGGFTPGMSVDVAVETAQRYADRGVRSVKLRVRALAEDIRLISGVREAMPDDFGIMVDANEKGDVITARALLRCCADYDVLWLEEPLPAHDRAGYAALARDARVPLAAGEHLQGTAEFQPFVESGSISVAQPDLALMGGLTECLRTAGFCEHYGIGVAPHFLPSLFAHLAAAAPNVIWLEDFPLLEPLFENPLEIGPGGVIEPLPEPGHGLKLAPHVLEELEVESP